MKKTLFRMDIFEEATFEGWTDGRLWNGWAKPSFEFEEAQKLVKVFVHSHTQMGEQAKAWYDQETDSFCFVLPDETEPECYGSEIVQIGDEQLKLYSIGAGAWIWEESLSNHLL